MATFPPQLFEFKSKWVYVYGLNRFVAHGCPSVMKLWPYVHKCRQPCSKDVTMLAPLLYRLDLTQIPSHTNFKTRRLLATYLGSKELAGVISISSQGAIHPERCSLIRRW